MESKYCIYKYFMMSDLSINLEKFPKYINFDNMWEDDTAAGE